MNIMKDLTTWTTEITIWLKILLKLRCLIVSTIVERFSLANSSYGNFEVKFIQVLSLVHNLLTLWTFVALEFFFYSSDSRNL